MADRSSEADEPELIADPDERARVEAENAIRQFDLAMSELKKWLKSPLRRLRPSDILALHRILMTRLNEYAGSYRPAKIKITGSKHIPPPSDEVVILLENMCEYISDNWDKKTAIHLSSYLLWKINWIHPFSDGNGRTARIVAYLILCAHSQKELPGDLTIPEQIAANKDPYYAALEKADMELKKGKTDVSALEELLSNLLANQLYDFYRKASGDDRRLSEIEPAELSKALEGAQREGAQTREAVLIPKKAKKNQLFSWIEEHPALSTTIGTVFAAVVTWLLTKFG